MLVGTRDDFKGHRMIIHAENHTHTDHGADPNCKSCYGADTTEKPCCDSCDEVKQAYEKKGWHLIELDRIEQCVDENPELKERWSHKVREALEEKQGCRIHGKLIVNRVGGNFYIAPGGAIKNEGGSLVHAFPGMKGPTLQQFVANLDHAHVVNMFHFGEHIMPNQLNPLDSVTSDFGKEDSDEAAKGTTSTKFVYFLKIVPSSYEHLNGKVLDSAQYSMTKHKSSAAQAHKLPGVWFDFSISPMIVRYTESRKSLTHFLTNLCAIVGGIFAVAGLIDSTLYRSLKIWQKQQIGKD